MATALFDQLQADFGLEQSVRDWLTAPTGLSATSLDDFLYAASSEADLGAMATAAGATNKYLMTSRLRQAWLSLKRARDDAELIKKHGQDDRPRRAAHSATAG